MQFDVYKNKNAASKERFPYLLDVQADLLQSLETRVVVPLAPKEAYASKTLTLLMPHITVKGKEYVAVTAQMAGIAKRNLGNLVENVADKRQEIIAAIDFLVTGV